MVFTECFGIHLRDNKRDGWVHAPGARVVYDRTPTCRRFRSELQAHVGPCAKECNVNASKSVRSRLLYRNLCSTERDAPSPCRRCQRQKRANGEVSLLEDADHGATNEASRANDGNDIPVASRAGCMRCATTHAASITNDPPLWRRVVQTETCSGLAPGELFAWRSLVALHRSSSGEVYTTLSIDLHDNHHDFIADCNLVFN